MSESFVNTMAATCRLGPGRGRLGPMLAVLAGVTMALAGVWMGVQPAAAAAYNATSIGRVSLAVAGGTEYVGYTNGNGNVSIACSNFSCGATTTDTAQYATGPGLATVSLAGWNGGQIITAWAGTDSQGHIYIGHYDGSNTIKCHTELPDTTFNSPYLLGAGGSTVWLAFTGTNSYLYIVKLDVSACSSNSGQIRETSHQQINDTSVAGPGITFAPGSSNLAVAWAGTDSARHIYAGIFTGGANLADHQCVCQYASFTDIGMDNDNGVIWMGYTGTNNNIYIAYSNNGFTYPGQTTDGNNTSDFGPDVTNLSSEEGDDAFTGTDGRVNVDTCVFEC